MKLSELKINDIVIDCDEKKRFLTYKGLSTNLEYPYIISNTEESFLINDDFVFKDGEIFKVEKVMTPIDGFTFVRCEDCSGRGYTTDCQYGEDAEFYKCGCDTGLLQIKL